MTPAQPPRVTTPTVTNPSRTTRSRTTSIRRTPAAGSAPAPSAPAVPSLVPRARRRGTTGGTLALATALAEVGLSHLRLPTA